ncbi:cryptochrome/photolyase family protein [Phycicoccus sonneratiae]|uniref:Cryptochrome/photolyase family protein n=1 Tax=Phycicoccus sonneratiae TaxID=2807628 RepID=A0ABS2CH87_9MICO|nr:cryptochrome/photolyase family protein [Phycicoccus sonneraticus]MBM6399232.1 cryptochrome/photolyase family protein [Phycicoccus sonneraticus]
MARSRRLRVVFPHQLFESLLDEPSGTRFVLVEDDLLFRQQPFHAQKLVLHRASMRLFADRLREKDFDVDVIETSARRKTRTRLAEHLADARPDEVRLHDVVDDWLLRDVRGAFGEAKVDLAPEDVEESPNFLTTRPELTEWFGGHRARMQTFYQWQRQRFDVLVEGPAHDRPVGGRWSFDTENRKKLPKGHEVPDRGSPERCPEVEEAIAWVGEEFPDAPGRADTFDWPVTHEQAREGLREFVAERLAQFGPYEDAVSTQHPFVFHAAITPALNCGLLDPREVLRAVLEGADEQGVDLPSLEGFVRQLIGWREYMRATYHLYGRRMRTSNHLRHTRSLAPGWWDASTGLDPVDHVVSGVLERGYAHHIERLMVLGNAMCLLRTNPTEVYEWFMAFFVDAYDWVMVPNVYAMSQFAAGTGITTKPYVSGSNYLRKMSDVGPGDWREDWDALYWGFVDHHREVFEGNVRARMVTRTWDGMDEDRREELLRRSRTVVRRL